MKFKDIKFHNRNESGEPDFGRYLHGYWVPKSDFERMWRAAIVELPKLDWSKLQCAETLYGTERWLAHKVGKRIALGRCLKFFADNNMLPIQVANRRKGGKRKYEHT